MTINQALDKLLSVKDKNLTLQDLEAELKQQKLKVGGNTEIQNPDYVANVIKFGTKNKKNWK